MHQFKFDIPMV